MIDEIGIFLMVTITILLTKVWEFENISTVVKYNTFAKSYYMTYFLFFKLKLIMSIQN